MANTPEVDAAILAERRRGVGIVLREFGIARLAGETKIMEVLDRIAIYLEHPETPPEG